MQNIIIGTAGHIDHGKTTLIKAITGKETDRLKEEKQRGISIDLGFTYFDLPSGRRAGIVDVPGHEKFVKNMLAGVGGMDIVILVIAADEGLMPQTKEHLNILSLLDIKKGIIALTKCDLVEEEWLEMVKEEVKEAVENTFLKEAPIIPLSSKNKIGIDKIVDKIDHMTLEVEERNIEKPFRLPIDRVFTITGFGTVVTGTLIEGTLKEGDAVRIYPSEEISKVRSLQVHEEKVIKAFAGQRVAVNISNIKKENVNRGDVLAPIDALKNTMMLDCKIKVLRDSNFPIRNRDRVRIYHGTSEILGRVVLLDKEELLPGQEGFAQLRLESTIATKSMDHIIIRFYSPMITIGGAIIINASPPKRKRFKEEVIQELKLKEKGDIKDIILQFLKEKSKDFNRMDTMNKNVSIPIDDFNKEIKSLIGDSKVIEINSGGEKYIFHPEFLGELNSKIIVYLEKFHRAHPLKPGISKEEIRSKFFGTAKIKLVDELLRYFNKKGQIKINGETIAKKDFEIFFNSHQKQIFQEIENKFYKEALNPPKPEELWKSKEKEKKQYEQVFEAMVQRETLIKIKEDIYFHKDSYREAVDRLKEYFESQDEINVASYRDLLKTSRKYAIALLEHFDNKKITKRVGDFRVLNRNR